MASNNDCGIREYEMERFQLLSHFNFPWPVNVSVPISELQLSWGWTQYSNFAYFLLF